jgi:pyruvate formate lyase activating enzyme
MTQWVVENLGSDVPWHFTAFHPDWRMRDVPATPSASLSRARTIAMRNGVRYAFTGNVHDPAGQGTFCSHCGTLLIGRDWYEITSWRLTPHAKCDACGTPCAGVFGSAPGTWGSKRMPVSIRQAYSVPILLQKSVEGPREQ